MRLEYFLNIMLEKIDFAKLSIYLMDHDGDID